MFNTFYRFIFSLCTIYTGLMTTGLANENFVGVASGLIEYSIKGKGILTPESNITIKGEASFYFDNWGTLNVEKEEGIFLVNGAIQHKQEIKRLEKRINNKIILVDYPNEQLLERKDNPLVTSENILTKGLVEEGEAIILGYTCKVWIGEGIKKYIYKGVLLRKEVEVFGISYIKMVEEIVLDINISKDSFIIPSYPIKEIGLFKEGFQIKNSMKVEDFCSRIKDIRLGKKNILDKMTQVNLRDKDRQVFINDIGEDTFRTQKKILPKFLVLLKETRFCLQTAETPIDANFCIEKFSRFTENFGTHVDDYIIVWNPKRKEDLLEKIEEDILSLNSRISCVNRANHLIDLSACMK